LKPPGKIRVGISACLLGRPTRYDGADKRDAGLVAALGPHVEWVPVCPEVECGLPVPRERMRLEGSPARPRLVTVESRIDQTARLTRWLGRRLRELEAAGLAGFVLKSRSPSCGLRGVPVYDASGACRKVGVGLLARALAARLPGMPIEEAGRLHDPAAMERFIGRVRADAGRACT